MLIFVYDYIDVTKFGNYKLNFLLCCLIKNSSHVSTIDVKTSILRWWRIVCAACGTVWCGFGRSECVAGGFVLVMCVCVCACVRECVFVGIVWLNDCCFKNHSFVSWRFIGIFVINDANYNINISEYIKDPLFLSIVVEILTGLVK